MIKSKEKILSFLNDTLSHSLLESVWPVGLENCSVSSLARSLSSSQNGESKSVLSEQVRSWSSDLVFAVQNDSSDDGNSVR